MNICRLVHSGYLLSKRVALGLIMISACVGQEWPTFRGPNSSGISDSDALPSRFDASQSGAWSVEAPFGRSSPIVINGQLVLTASDDTHLIVLGLDARTGKQRWRYSRPRPRRNELDAIRNDPASASPAADNAGVYAFFPDFGLIALTPGGALRWSLPLGPFVNNYGMASSPVVYGDSVFLQVDQTHDSYLLCVNKLTGAVRWKRMRPSTAEGWSTPILTPRGEIVTLSSSGLEAFDSRTGKSLWAVDAPNALMIPVPLIDEDRIVATFRGSDKALFPNWKDTLAALDADGDGRLVPDELDKRYKREDFGIADPNRDGYITEGEWIAFISRGVGKFGITSIQLADRRVLWRHKRGLPYVPSPLVYRKTLYSVRSGGILTALDSQTGELKKEARLGDAGGDYFASLVAGAGKVFAVSANGRITVINATEPWEILSSSDLGESVGATPAIAAGAIFIRTDKRVFCFRSSD